MIEKETRPSHDTNSATPVPGGSSPEPPRPQPQNDGTVLWPEDPARRRARLARISQWIYFLFGLAGGLLAIRLVLKLFGANAEAAFASFIYGVTEPLVGIFRDVFPTLGTGVGVLESQSVIAFIIYALMGWVIVQVVWLWGDQ